VDLPSPEKGAALYVWPNFRVDGWNRYYVAFFSPSSPHGRGVLESVFDGTTYLQLHTEFAAIDFTPDDIVIRWDDDHGDDYYACYRAQAEFTDLNLKKSPLASEVTLGFDFGTTNTAASVFFVGSENNIHAPLSIGDCTLRLMNGLTDPSNTWLPQPKTGKLSSIPSLLYFSARGYLPSASPEAEPVRDYTIPFFQSDADLGDWVGQFKWANKLDGLSHKAYALRYLYNRLALQIFLAELVNSFRLKPCDITLIATAPLAFSESDRVLHNQALQDILAEIKAATGFKMVLGPAVDESHAAEACGVLIPKADRTIHVDVGGGSTDICISGQGTEGRFVSVVDSIEFGGEDVNTFVSQPRISGLSVVQLGQQIRLHGTAVYHDPSALNGTQANVDSVKKVLDRFAEALIEAIGRFIAAQVHDMTSSEVLFGIIMAGSGWKSTFDASDHDTIAAEVGQRVHQKLEGYCSKNLIPFVPSVRSLYPPNPKQVVSMGAAKFRAAEFHFGQSVSKTYVLENVRALVAGSEQELPWYRALPLDFPVHPAELSVVQPSFSSEDWSKVVPNEFEFCMKNNRLVRSALALYLTKYYKRWDGV
jgi:hypothetical protein